MNNSVERTKPSVGFIGLGVMGHRMLTNMSAHGGFDITRAWDPDPRACEVVRQAFPTAVITESAEDLVRDREVDVVYIASPPASHHTYTLLAAAESKAIYCEKPLGVDISSSSEMVDAVESAGVLNVVNFPFAESQPINLIQAKLRDNTVGDVTRVDLRLHFSNWPRDWQAPARWLMLREQGGFVREVVSHYVYLVEKLFGPATVVDTHVSFPDDPSFCETHFFTRLECGGRNVYLGGGAGGIGPDIVEFTIWGTKTSLRLWDWNKLKSTDGSSWREELKELSDPRQDGYHRMLDNFRNALEGREHTMPSFRTALSVQHIIEEILSA